MLRDWDGSASVYASLSTENPDAVIFSDASGDVGYGAIEIRSHNFGSGIWSGDELKLAGRDSSISSTHLEIMAIAKAIRTFAKPFQAVQVFADSAAAVFVLQKRYDRRSDHSQGLMIALDKFCRDNGISLYFTHVPRSHKMIQIVDDLSKNIVPKVLVGWERVKLISIDPVIF